MARVLVPVDDEEHARQGCDLATELFHGERFLLLHVIDPTGAGYNPEPGMPGVTEDWYETAETEAEQLLGRLCTHIKQRDDDATVEQSVEVGQPAQTIVQRVEQGDIDHVVMGSHGRDGISRLLLGSVAEAVVRNSPAPVTVVR